MRIQVLSATVGTSREEVRALMSALYYRFCSSQELLGGETTSLLPFLLLPRAFGRRDNLSTTVFAPPKSFRAERRPLYYRFCSSQELSGGETTSLLPFLLLPRAFGRRDNLSTTVFAPAQPFPAETIKKGSDLQCFKALRVRPLFTPLTHHQVTRSIHQLSFINV